MSHLHHYKATTVWQGNRCTGTSGLRAYDRSHVVRIEGKPELQLTTDNPAVGDKTKLNPEDLLVSAIASCHMLSYLYVCALDGVVVTAYTDHATGTMLEHDAGGGQFQEVTLNPEVRVADASMIERALELHHEAHRICFIASSVHFEVRHNPVCRPDGSAGDDKRQSSAAGNRPITFQPVQDDDLPLLADIINHYIEHTTVSFHTEALRPEDMREKVFFGDAVFQAFTIRDGGQPIGYCAVSPWKKQQAYRGTAEVNIYLSPGYTGAGIGSMAIRHLEAHAQAHSIRNLIAGLCSENLPSRRLFEKNGFVQCAHFRGVGEKFGRTLDTIYLQKTLSP